MTPSRRAIGALARLDLLDRLRTGMGPALVVQPLGALFALMFVVAGPLLGDADLDGRGYDIAVAHASPMPGSTGDRVLESLRRFPDEVRLVADPDPAAAVSEARADAALVIEGERVRVVADVERGASRSAAAAVARVVARAEDARVAGDEGSVRIERRDLMKTPVGGRLALGYFVPFFVLHQLASLIAETSARIRGDKTNRAAESVFVLPVRRLDILLGRGVVGLVEGVVRTAVLLLLVVTATNLVKDVATFSMPATALVALAAAAAVQIPLCVALGCALGAFARTEGQEAVVAFTATMAPAVVLLGLAFGGVGALSPAAGAIPFLGPALWARNAFFGGELAVSGLAMLISSAALVAGALWFGARALNRDGVTLRTA